MEKIVFTIVAKNYIPLARALGWSLANNNSTPVKYIIFLADEPDEYLQQDVPNEIIIPISTIGIDNLFDLAFKYNVTEFCTAVKPACFKYIFGNFNADKAIYFDPDIFVFNDLEVIYNDLETKDIVVTPHYVTPQINYTGDQKENSTLFVGIYNFGFVAFKNTPHNEFILNWWENRLSDQCYADWQDGLHTDQKWADFLPVYATDTLHISKSIGFNLAPWNLFERKIFKDENIIKVQNRITGKIEDLTFVHFAGYDPNDLKTIHKDFWHMPIEKYPDYNIVRDLYVNVTTQLKFNDFKQSQYTYGVYSNGTPIQAYHRRLYRALVESGTVINDPFSTEGEFYNTLYRSGLIDKQKPQNLNSKTYQNFDNRLKNINKLLLFLFKILGTQRYFLLMKLMNRYSRSENQIFLINQKNHKIY